MTRPSAFGEQAGRGREWIALADRDSIGDLAEELTTIHPAVGDEE